MAAVVMYPYKSLLDVNTEVHNQLLSVVESFKDINLTAKAPNYNRTVGAIIAHALKTSQLYFLRHVALGEPLSEEYSEEEIPTVEEATRQIKENLKQTNEMIKSFPEEKLNEEIKTEWGTTMSREMAIWQGLIQIMLHLGEITLIAGMEGFYEGTLG